MRNLLNKTIIRVAMLVVDLATSPYFYPSHAEGKGRG